MNAVQQIKQEIEKLVAAHECRLERYQANGGGFATEIHYVVIPAELARPLYFYNPKSPSNARDVGIDFVTLHNREGETEKCEAYRKLKELYNRLLSR